MNVNLPRIWPAMCWGEFAQMVDPPVSTKLHVWRKPENLSTVISVQVVVPEAGKEFRSEYVVSDRSIYETLAEDEIYRAIFRELLRNLAPRLYEWDPRIGTPFGKLPSLPLFDRPDGAHLRQYDLIKSKEPVYCPCCRWEMHPDRIDGLGGLCWGGGNFGWVHRSCLPRKEVYQDQAYVLFPEK